MNNYTLYVVEAPTVEPGQTVSTGGIRKDGKMVAQFRNPVPLEQQISNSPAVTTAETTRLIPDRNHEVVKDIAFEILSDLWNDFGRPLLKSQLRCFSQKLINRLQGTVISNVPLEAIEADFEIIPH